MNLPTVTISGTHLSDLFFNSEKPHWNKAMEKHTETEGALMQDAANFIGDMDIAGQVTVCQLTDDFMKRL